MNKLQMAHEYAKILLANPQYSPASIRDISWMLADAMQAEADKRISSHIKSMVDGYMTAPIQVIDENGECRITTRSNEWQPDWSQAPDWAKWWAMDADRKCHWFSKEPDLHNGVSEYILGNNGEGLDNIFLPSLDCEYTGDWRNSLRKRP